MGQREYKAEANLDTLAFRNNEEGCRTKPEFQVCELTVNF